MGKFRSKAAEKTTQSILMLDRESMTPEQVAAAYPKGVTVVDFDMVNGSDEQYPIFLFAEDDNKFFSGGTVLKAIANEWLDGYESVEDCRKDFAEEVAESGGIKMIITPNVRSKKTGRLYTKIDVL